MDTESTSPFDWFTSWAINHSFVFIFVSAIFLIFFEIIEPLIKKESIFDPFHIAEVSFFLFLLLLVRKLIVSLAQVNIFQSQMLESLRFKHEVSLALSKLENPQELKNEITRLLGGVVDAEAVHVHFATPFLNEEEQKITWDMGDGDSEKIQFDCRHCIKDYGELTDSYSVVPCDINITNTKNPSQEYCFPVNFGNNLLATIKIKLKPSAVMSDKDIEKISSIKPEVALVLIANQRREAVREMQDARIALMERRTVSSYIHDHLGQNLGFLHLKLDQLLENQVIQKEDHAHSVIMKLRDVANESYEIVRDILKVIRSETTPNISNLLKEQARSVSRRGNFKLDFQTTGTPFPLSSAVQQSVFFTFCEILNNIEKHARAKEVNVKVAWNDDSLDVSVSDNGTGFEPENVSGDRHFGLQIMKERMEGVKGSLKIRSLIDSGTIISILVPLGQKR